jgi:mannose-6-phosphate isomerase-like protein (cupin superfamily)
MNRELKESDLLKVADKLNFEPHRLRLDQSGRYDEALDHEFPFLIKLFRFCHNDFTPIHSRHERLELFVPVDGTVSMLMGERRVDIGPGELLIVENMKLHRILDIPGLNTRVVVISFMSNFVYSLGSPPHDYFFLLPFYTNVGNRLPIVRDAVLLVDIHQIVARLLKCYFDRTTYFQIGCKAYFLELLYILAEFFRAADFRYSELIRQQERSTKLKAGARVCGPTFRSTNDAERGGFVGKDERAAILQVVQEGGRDNIRQLRNSRSTFARRAFAKGEFADHR